MQIFALEEKNLISAFYADKGKNYLCPECGHPVRVKQGEARHSHFFHIHSSKRCRQSSKGLIHLRLQRYIHYLFPGSIMERPFPEVGRIADVADETRKVIFEIQYSPISLEEAKQRCADYEGLGYQIIWILHDHTFNKEKVAPAEQFLRTKTCYFSDMDEIGNWSIYDQLEEIQGKKRLWSDYPVEVQLKHPKPLPLFKWPEELDLRAQSWPLYHKGDHFDLCLQGMVFFPDNEEPPLWEKIKKSYLALLYSLLEKSST